MTLTLIPDYDLSKHTWLGVGGKADLFAEVDNEENLISFLKNSQCPITVLGAGSNVLIRDGGISGVVLKLGADFQKIEITGDKVIAGAGAKLMEIAQKTAKSGLAGFEFMEGIPGTLGGGLASNAGAFGSCLSDLLQEVFFTDFRGNTKTISDFSDWGYRYSPYAHKGIFLGGVLQAKRFASSDEISALMQKYHEKRAASQPQGVRTAGSTFKNPKEGSAGFLLEKSGLKGYKKGNAEMSTKHANFLVNHGATATELEDFVNEVRSIVAEKQGVKLEWEVQCLGRKR
ncbi:MAG: UDP-N-acetylmuramate dehydrogenase [Alphaproteobacteria bacterium]|nr:UDP-N-acetylmuramate dehydrogenase [Alphaproteobacteria bacterium]